MTAGFDVPLVDNASLSPFVRMTLSRVKLWDGHFGGDLARSESVVDPIRVEPEVGAQFSARLLEDENKVLVLRASSSVGYDMRNQAHDGHMQFSDVGGRVWLPGLQENTTTLRTNLAFDLRRASGLTFSLVYSGAYRGDMEGHAGMFQGRYRF